MGILHDLAIPGSRANGDHLLIGPPGVFLVDSKAWHGRITFAGDGSAWYGPTRWRRCWPPSGGKLTSSPERSARRSPRWCASTVPRSLG